MAHKITPFFLFFLFLLSCGDKPLVSENKSFDHTELNDCKDKACPEVSVTYIEYTGEEEVTNKINDSIVSYIAQALYLGDIETAPLAKNIPDAVVGFIKAYWVDTSEFPEVNEYEADVTIEELSNNDAIVSLALYNYTYTGGAHGYGGTYYKNFDAETGATLTNKELFKDLNAFTAFAETKFRETFQISENEIINADRFWFDKDTFYVPENIGFSEENLLILYNPYEIASYADGAIEIEIPLEEAAPYLNYQVD